MGPVLLWDDGKKVEMTTTENDTEMNEAMDQDHAALIDGFSKDIDSTAVFTKEMLKAGIEALKADNEPRRTEVFIPSKVWWGVSEKVREQTLALFDVITGPRL